MAEPAKPDRDTGIDVDELHRSMAAAGLRIVAGPGPLREVLPEAITELTGGAFGGHVTRDKHRRAIYLTASQTRGKRAGLVLLCSGPDCHGAEMFAAGLTVADVVAAADAHIDSVDPDAT